MAAIKLEIITPVHNRCSQTLQCIRSLKRSRLEGIEIHIIVVDDGSTDGTSEALRLEFPEVEIVQGDGNLWYTAGTNRGLSAALKHEPDYILAINNDSIFDENCVWRMVECAENHPRSVVGALLLSWESPHKVFQVSPRWELWEGGMRHWRHQTIWTVPEKPWEVELIVGNCVLYPARAVREAGFMDEKKLVQYGDAEYTPRMKKMGWRLLIEPRARVFCQPNDPPSGFRKMSLRTKISETLLKPAGPYSIFRRYNMTVGSAPRKSEGVAAFMIYLIRASFGRSVEGTRGEMETERPLSEIFADAVVDD